LPYTLSLAIPVLIISFFAGNRIGARAAYLKGKWNETGYFSLVFCNQLPAFWFAMVLLFLYTAILRAIPPLGANSPGVLPSPSLSFIWDAFIHWCLPFLSLVVIYLGGWSTGMRSMVTHEMDADYVRYGKQLGFREKKLMSYTERNAILPQFTGLNLVFSGIIGNTMIIEIVFGWPGIGLLLFNAIGNLDYPIVFGCFFIIILIIVVGNFLIDILYGFLDPRIRTGQR
jgi:peptide/nickel transport system permease protein